MRLLEKLSSNEYLGRLSWSTSRAGVIRCVRCCLRSYFPDSSKGGGIRVSIGSIERAMTFTEERLIFSLMGANSIVEPHYVDAADVPPILAATEQSPLAHSREEQLAIRQVAYGLASHATEELSIASPWIVSGARRCFDSAVAALVLFILLPVMFLIMLLVRASSPGPVVFRQRRAGRNRKEFTLYKFRSMRVENSPGPAITVSGDARITPIGAFLRRHKLDELPQFWNVLKGNMSLVGPRPKLPHHEGLDLPYRPGITGMATLLFRNEEEILSRIPHCQLEAFYETCIKPKKAQLDQEYMQNATLWTDLKLLWRTAASCVFGPGKFSLKKQRSSCVSPPCGNEKTTIH